MQHLGKPLREAEWIAKQRKQFESEKVKRGVKRPLQETLAKATRLGQASWTAQHEKASVKLEAKTFAAKLKAYEDGFLLPSEIGDDLLEAVKIFKAKRAKIEQQHENNYDKIKRKLAVRPPVDLAGGVVFIDPILQDIPEVKQVIRQHKLTAVSAREEACIFVVPDLKQPGQRTTWAMSLCGGLLVPQSTFCDKKQAGAVIRFKAAVVTKRMVFITKAFATCHPVLTSLITAASKLDTSKWTLISKAVYVAHNAQQAAREKRLQRIQDAVAVVTKSQKEKEPPLLHLLSASPI